jgi:hypothetical protein
MPNDPISRLEVCQREIDRVFGQGHAAAHPELVASVMLCATLDQCAAVIAAALVIEEVEPQPHIVPARQLVRP